MTLNLSGSTGISGVDGSASTPALQGTDTNTGIHYPAADTVGISTGGTERLRIDSSGRVGIGTTSPSGNLHVVGTGKFSGNVEIGGIGQLGIDADYDVTGATAGKIITNPGITNANSTFTFAVNEGTGAQMQLKGDGACIWSEGSTERARIDDVGRLLVGTSSAYGTAYTTPVQVKASGSLAGGVSIVSSNNENAGGLVLNSSSDNSIRIDSDPDNLRASSYIGFNVDATERMRINNTGLLSFACTSLPTSGTPGVALSAAGNVHCGVISTANTDVMRFDNPNGRVGAIQVTGSSTSYVTSSDYRLKENVVPLTGAADRLNQLQVHRFNFIADPDTTVDGFIAHEAQAVVPECVTGTKDEVDDEGNPVYQGIDQSKLVPLLTAALQEALAEIESLKARVTALEP